jgi:hypothetical protein
MTYRQLFLFVEGDDDERFLSSVVVPALLTAYGHFRFVQFSSLKKEKLRGFLRSVVAMKADYILVRDLDRLPCVTAAKDEVLRSLPQVNPDRVQIVKAEIESWYCAGISEDHPWRSLTIGRCTDTSSITKEILEAAVFQEGQPKLPTMLELLESFDREAAVQRNESFRRFLRKFVPSVIGS